ncbi:hypothetical protein Lsan_2718 [Legionella santicrucis]|uniref:Uncharacterized protein n=1 Tax=Legionella santicrucis TaxID=45074 RepID=A0A0W0YJ42_9GAMM|nr:hypothetical protein [Legionella santicrucis]KTD56558.1 hypothetical protein Lsan_2718 [Legionella santicrucis]
MFNYRPRHLYALTTLLSSQTLTLLIANDLRTRLVAAMTDNNKDYRQNLSSIDEQIKLIRTQAIAEQKTRNGQLKKIQTAQTWDKQAYLLQKKKGSMK